MTAASEHVLKGQEISLTERDPLLKRVFIGIGWDAPNEYDGHTVDVDAAAFLLRRDGKVRSDTDFVFYNNLSTENEAIVHKGDNVTGFGDGDDEIIELNLETMPYDIDKVAFSVTIHNAEERGQTFGIVHNAFIRVVNRETGLELARYDLSEDASEDNSMIFGELVREGLGWKFRAVGQGSSGGLYRVARDFGVNVAPP